MEKAGSVYMFVFSIPQALRFNDLGVLVSVQSTESLARDSTEEDNVLALLSYPISSHSQLTLVDRELGRDYQRPSDLRIGSITVEQVSFGLDHWNIYLKGRGRRGVEE
jgi:hypothetical protein